MEGKKYLWTLSEQGKCNPHPHNDIIITIIIRYTAILTNIENGKMKIISGQSLMQQLVSDPHVFRGGTTLTKVPTATKDHFKKLISEAIEEYSQDQNDEPKRKHGRSGKKKVSKPKKIEMPGRRVSMTEDRWGGNPNIEWIGVITRPLTFKRNGKTVRGLEVTSYHVTSHTHIIPHLVTCVPQVRWSNGEKEPFSYSELVDSLIEEVDDSLDVFNEDHWYPLDMGHEVMVEEDPLEYPDGERPSVLYGYYSDPSIVCFSFGDNV